GFPGGFAFGDSRARSLPAVGPIAPERPVTTPEETRIALASLSYRQEEASSDAGSALSRLVLDPDSVVGSWKRMNDAFIPASEGYVAAGSFTSVDEAEQLSKTMNSFGRTVVERTVID